MLYNSEMCRNMQINSFSSKDEKQAFIGKKNTTRLKNLSMYSVYLNILDLKIFVQYHTRIMHIMHEWMMFLVLSLYICSCRLFISKYKKYPILDINIKIYTSLQLKSVFIVSNIFILVNSCLFYTESSITLLWIVV